MTKTVQNDEFAFYPLKKGFAPQTPENDENDDQSWGLKSTIFRGISEPQKIALTKARLLKHNLHFHGFPFPEKWFTLNNKENPQHQKTWCMTLLDLRQVRIAKRRRRGRPRKTHVGFISGEEFSWTESGKKKEPQPKLFGPGVFGWGWASSTWRGGGQKVQHVLKTQEKTNFLGGYPGGARKIWEMFNFWPLTRAHFSLFFQRTAQSCRGEKVGAPQNHHRYEHSHRSA